MQRSLVGSEMCIRDSVYRIRTLSIRRNSVQGIENTLHAAIVYNPLALAAADRINYIEYRTTLAVVYAMRTLWHVHYLYHIVYQFPIGLRYWKPSPVLRRSHGCRHDKYYRQQDSPDIYTRSHIPYIKSLRNPCGTGSQSRRQTRHTKHPPVVGKYTKSIWTNTITPTFLLRASFGITSWMLRARPLPIPQPRPSHTL